MDQFIACVTILLLFDFFGHEVCGILAPLPGIELKTPVLEGEVLTTRPPVKYTVVTDGIHLLNTLLFPSNNALGAGCFY